MKQNRGPTESSHVYANFIYSKNCITDKEMTWTKWLPAWEKKLLLLHSVKSNKSVSVDDLSI